MRDLAKAAAILSLLSGPASAAPTTDPAAASAERFCEALVQAVKDSQGKGAEARARRLQPVLEQNLNVPIMGQFATGAAWTTMTAAERARFTAALARYSAARFAQEFDSYSGQRCQVDPVAETRGPDRLVRSHLLQPHDAPVSLNYRLREYGGAWKVIDIYYEGVGELATERADFAGVLKTGGTAGLIERLEQLTARLRRPEGSR